MLFNCKTGRASFALAVASALAALAVLALAQQKPILSLASEKSGLRLTVSADKLSYHVGESIEIATNFRNVSGGPIEVFVDRPVEVFDRFSVVRMESPNSATPVELTSVGEERLDLMRFIGRRSSFLQRNEALDETFDIAPWYVMPPGTYKIACYIDMSTDMSNLSRLRFVSDELTITIIP